MDTKPISVITDHQSKVNYTLGTFLGKGGFGQCYECWSSASGEQKRAVKVVANARLIKPDDRKKVEEEIKIHQTLSHKHIVSLYKTFADKSNIYMILELCRKRTLFALKESRKRITVPEVRYFMRQIFLACDYLHERKIVHRDFKPQNIFFNVHMEVKVGDFGLATRIRYEGDKRTAFCGTRVYMSPEMLGRTGHSYETDVWSLGCIMYILLVGMPPFKDEPEVEVTLDKMKKCDYLLPSRLNRSAQELIQKLLHPDPGKRPNACDILKDNFFTPAHIPSRLPWSCLTIKPRFSPKFLPLWDVPVISIQCSSHENNGSVPATIPKEAVGENAAKGAIAALEVEIAALEVEDVSKNYSQMPKDFHLNALLKMLNSVLAREPEKLFSANPGDARDPSTVPSVWVREWIDHTEKYGMGYMLSNNSGGVLYNDKTRLILLQDGVTLHYMGPNKEEQFFTITEYPPDLSNKMILLKNFNAFMRDKEDRETTPVEKDEATPVPHLRTFHRMDSAIIFHLTNGTLQINFFKVGSKLVLCPITEAVTLFDKSGNLTVYKFQLIEKFGCSSTLAEQLEYARMIVKDMCDQL